MTTEFLEQLVREHPINLKRLCEDANVPFATIYQKIFYKTRELKTYEEERLKGRLDSLKRFLGEDTMREIDINLSKREAIRAYTEAKERVEKIKVLQQNIEKLLNEIRELSFGFDPKKIVEASK